ncbi:ADP-dependent glucokinase-like isoform X2 [Corticium candelabrum]|nr:ADP-dependent glucokinase-like isoform X2 [Corticium candelabrum]
MFEHRMARCAAAERVFAHQEGYLEIVDHAHRLENKQYFVGGNAALVGLKMASTFSDTKILLGGPVGDQLERLLLPNMEVPDGCRQKNDEVHLILEYKSGETWGSTTASCSNRFIFSYDIGNSNLLAMESFFTSLESFKPDLVVLSGLHLLEKLDESVWKAKIKELTKHLSEISVAVPIHLELASTASLDLLLALSRDVFPRVTSVGLNDQELMSVSKADNGPHSMSESVSGHHQIGLIADQLQWMLESFGVASSAYPKSKLSRVHFHSFIFHLIAVIHGKWQNSITAVGAAARMAAIQACDSKIINANSVELKMSRTFLRSVEDPQLRADPIEFDPSVPISHWSRRHVDLFMSPVLICKHPTKTVGLGDAISATGLQNSLMIS